MNDDAELVRGSDNPFRDVGLADADTELMKADLATGIVRVLRERALSGAEAARMAEVSEADISRIRKASLHRFTIDRLVQDPQSARPRHARQRRVLADAGRPSGRSGACLSGRTSRPMPGS